MQFSASQYVELTVVLVMGISLFAAVYRLPERVTIFILLLILPVQFVDSRYGTSNMVITYLVAFSFLLQGRLRSAPLLIPVVILLFAYALSFSMSHPAARIHHLFYLIAFFSNVLLFYIVFNFVRRTGEWEFILKALLYTNAVVIVACAFELTAGDSQFRLFGLDEWAVDAARARAGRIVGPFGSTHTTADYLVAQTCISAFLLVYAAHRKMKLALLAIVACNCMILVATGDRGGFVGLVVGALAFFFLFRKDIGTLRSVKLLSIGAFLFIVSSIVMVNYTDFGVLYERLEETEVESSLSDTRGRGFRNGMAYFQESPILGLGPKLAVSTKSRVVADIPYRPYPHILVMYILSTLGIVGLLAWAIFFMACLTRLLGALHARSADIMHNRLPILGLLVFALFFAGELRIEFLRTSFLDYQHFIFVLLGLFVASADLLKEERRRMSAALAAPSVPRTQLTTKLTNKSV